MNSIKKFKIAIVHDDFIQKGGAEFLILNIALFLNKSDEFEVIIFSSLISDEWKKILKDSGLGFQESFLKYFPFSYKISKLFVFFDLFNLAFQSFCFDDYDAVISSSTRFAQNIITKPQTLHLSYINAPARFIWEESVKNFIHSIIDRNIDWYKETDTRSQKYADLIIANSKNIKRKIKNNYNLNSIVLHPFTDIQMSDTSIKKEYFVLISRLKKWKRIDFVIEAFNTLGWDLKIIGQGEEFEKLKSVSNSNIEFLGYVSDDEKKILLQEAKGLIFPQNEDFGLTLVESLRSGTPIIYFNQGGAREILNDTFGTPFDLQNKESLIKALEKFKNCEFESKKLHLKSLKFHSSNFIPFLKKLLITQIKMKKNQI